MSVRNQQSKDLENSSESLTVKEELRLVEKKLDSVSKQLARTEDELQKSKKMADTQKIAIQQTTKKFSEKVMLLIIELFKTHMSLG